MNTQELERLLEAGRETPEIEYKGPCEWDVNLFAKDILAMANIEGGGWIIVGIKATPRGYKREGVTKNQMVTFNYDIMKDQLAKFADPHVDFSVHFPKDKDGKQFVVIRVYEFKEIPVICIKSSDKAGTKEPTIYYRNTDKKIESGPISNYHDLRDLIERAAIKIRKKWKNLGLKIDKEFEEKLEREFKNFQ